MSDGFNKPQYHAVRQKSAHEPAVGEEFEWRGRHFRCVSGDGCKHCAFNRDFRKTLEHREEAADGCRGHFCEIESRADRNSVKFVEIKEAPCQTEQQ